MTGGRYLAVRLPMYDWPEVREANAHLESFLQASIIDALGLPASEVETWPSGSDLVETWANPDLLLAQTCGYPLTHALHGKVRLLGAPQYGFEGCDGPRYCSQLVVRRDSQFERLEQLRGKRAVFNGSDSQSGMNAFRRSIAEIANGSPFFSGVRISGGHLMSMQSVVEGGADIASIDAVCWGLACRELPALANQLRPIGRTASAPGLPLITSQRFSDAETDSIAEAVAFAFSAAETRKSRERLGIHGFSKLELKHYASIPLMEQQAREMGYPDLA